MRCILSADICLNITKIWINNLPSIIVNPCYLIRDFEHSLLKWTFQRPITLKAYKPIKPINLITPDVH